ncbi:SDR family NAD(P)-dependent oxidoreductase [Methylophilaceae bacterium]|jgi:3-oxoacyl-[acyl-carrier protein] reductase|nr:SDR family NAD(P)-dependent oxidoreductase [Methylophilaceae bacterium]
MKSKKSRNAVITGSTQGIGLAIAREFLERGHNVYICGRDEIKLKKVLKDLSVLFGSERVHGSVCDVSSLVSVEKMIKESLGHFGSIDVLVNNAGVGFVTPFEKITPDQWSEIINVNLTGVYNCCRAALPWLKKNKVSDIINLGSRAGRYASAGGAGYNTTKFGLQGFTEALFLDLNQYGVRVSLVAPGNVSSGFADIIGGLGSEEWFLSPSDVAKVVADIIASNSRANVNWVEIRPSRPE